VPAGAVVGPAVVWDDTSAQIAGDIFTDDGPIPAADVTLSEDGILTWPRRAAKPAARGRPRKAVK
jgi:hypothetical protein